jgi:hypothetical protein
MIVYQVQHMGNILAWKKTRGIEDKKRRGLTEQQDVSRSGKKKVQCSVVALLDPKCAYRKSPGP